MGFFVYLFVLSFFKEDREIDSKVYLDKEICQENIFFQKIIMISKQNIKPQCAYGPGVNE